MYAMMILMVVRIIVVLVIWVGRFHQTTYAKIQLFCEKEIEAKHEQNDKSFLASTPNKNPLYIRMYWLNSLVTANIKN